MFAWLRRLIPLLIIIAIVVGAALVGKRLLPQGWRRPGAPTAPGGVKGEMAEQAVPVRVYRAARTLFRDQLYVMGTVKGTTEIEIRPEVPGILSSFKVAEGDIVSAGDVIAELDQRDATLKVRYAESKLATAQAALEGSRLKLQMHEDLFAIGAIVQAKLDEVRAETTVAEKQVETAQVEVESARAEVEKTVLKAPVEGVLTTKDAEPGEFVSPQSKAATMMEIYDIFVVMGVIEKDIDRVGLAQPVTVTVETYPGVEFQGVVDEISPIVEGKSRTLTVKARIPNPDSRLLPGMFARATIVVFEQADALVIPSIALHREQEAYHVFVVADGVAQQRAISVGYITTDYAQIADGLQEGDQVIVEAQSTLKDGAHVEVLEVQESTL